MIVERRKQNNKLASFSHLPPPTIVLEIGFIRNSLSAELNIYNRVIKSETEQKQQSATTRVKFHSYCC